MTLQSPSRPDEALKGTSSATKNEGSCATGMNSRRKVAWRGRALGRRSGQPQRAQRGPHVRLPSPAQRRADPGRGIAAQCRRYRLLHPRGKLPAGARCAARRQRHPHHRHPPRGCRLEHGRCLRQADRPTRHLLRHPRPRCHPCGEWRAHGAAGLDADDPVRRPGGKRLQGPRGVPGSRLRADVLGPGQVGRGNRPYRTHPGDRRPRLQRRHLGPTGPGRGRPARGNPLRFRAGRRCAGAKGASGAAGRHGDGGTARTAGERQAPPAGTWRQRLGQRRQETARRLRRGQWPAGRHLVPSPGPVRQP